MVDAALTFVIVAAAALFVVWRVALPAGLRARLKRAAGRDCVADASASGCPGGCSGCALATPRARGGGEIMSERGSASPKPRGGVRKA
jgi:hypothetical protein